MKKRIFLMGLLLLIAFLLCAVLFLNGNYIVYMLSYVFCFAFLFCYIVFSSSVLWEKIAQALVYALIMAAQILFAVLVLRLSGDEELYRLMGVAFLFAPFLVRQIFF